MSKTKQTGFTLIETSIVLAVLALTVGGVLTGQRLLRRPRANSFIIGLPPLNQSKG
jgi:prepilin-type N-terminal cleavage/methylation domain-containing protein